MVSHLRLTSMDVIQWLSKIEMHKSIPLNMRSPRFRTLLILCTRLKFIKQKRIKKTVHLTKAGRSFNYQARVSIIQAQGIIERELKL